MAKKIRFKIKNVSYNEKKSLISKIEDKLSVTLLSSEKIKAGGFNIYFSVKSDENSASEVELFCSVNKLQFERNN